MLTAQAVHAHTFSMSQLGKILCLIQGLNTLIVETAKKEQTIILLQMFKGDENLQYECGNTGIYRDKPCVSRGRIGVVQVNDHKFDMYLTLHNAAPKDAEVYTVQVEVVNPDSSEVSSFSKTFEVHTIGKS